MLIALHWSTVAELGCNDWANCTICGAIETTGKVKDKTSLWSRSHVERLVWVITSVLYSRRNGNLMIRKHARAEC